MSLALRSLFLFTSFSVLASTTRWINRFQGIYLWSDNLVRLAVHVFQLPIKIEQLKLAGRLSCCTGVGNPIQLSAKKAV